jgi:hypothetical protein
VTTLTDLDIPELLAMRTPVPDEIHGLLWWNALTHRERAEWLASADSARPADAWATFKRTYPAATTHDAFLNAHELRANLEATP